MKVLLLPSWYPNSDQNYGSFFQEQAQFLNENEFDIKVLMAEELHTKNYWYQRIKRLVTGKSSGLSKAYLHQDPEAYAFPLILQKSWSEAQQIKALKQHYLKAFEQLVDSGWIPEIIHVQGALKAGFAAKHISEVYNIPYVIIEHSPFKLSAHSKFLQGALKHTLLHANKVAGVSRYQKQRLLDDGIERDIEVVWNLMDETKFDVQKNRKDDKFRITTITRPIKIKDVDTFFKAVADFINTVERPETVEVVAVGHNALFDRNANTNYYDKKAAELGISQYCKFHALLTRDDILELLQNTSVFISTSLDEPYGVAIREAMLCGIPVISTRSGGPEDSIEVETGVLVDLKDHKAITKALTEIYSSDRSFDSNYIRNYVVSQSGCQAFLKRMKDFYIND